jgi:hypothetical protein
MRVKRVHPKSSRRIIGALMLFGVVGCRSTSNGVTNPFLAPDRVPPPSTRALLPGQAQPYYQGDPLPQMQSGNNPANNPASNALAASPSEATLSSTGRTLAWTAPGAAPSTVQQAPVPTTPVPAPVGIAGNETSVAVPPDADPLRFSLPPARTAENTPVVTIPSAQPTIPSARPVTPPPTPSGVQLASFTAPAPTAPPTVPSAPPLVSPQPSASVWRSPQITQPGSTQPTGAMPVAFPAPPAAPAMQPQPVTPINSVGATLRAVAPPEPGDPLPRVRIPGYVSPEIATTDGFRPRTSMQ